MVALVGGDTTRGPLTISITIMGEVPAGLALYRAGAKPGDEIWVSGELGGASLGLVHQLGRVELESAAAAAMLARLHEPEPRVALGERLRGLATAAIDVSDGFAGDLAHIDFLHVPGSFPSGTVATVAEQATMDREARLFIEADGRRVLLDHFQGEHPVAAHGKRTSNCWEAKELCQVVNVPSGPLAFDFQRSFGGVTPQQG